MPEFPGSSQTLKLPYHSDFGKVPTPILHMYLMRERDYTSQTPRRTSKGGGICFEPKLFIPTRKYLKMEIA